MHLLNFLRLPDAQLITDPDSAEVSKIHYKIIQSKPFLKRLYIDFYKELKDRLPLNYSKGGVVEIGSGGGFIKEIIPEVATSDLFTAPWVDHVFSADKMPFKDGSVDAFLLLNVFHHLPKAEACIKEMSRCLRPKGKIIMIEPANTPWSRFVTKNFHHEMFDVKAGWDLEGEGRLSAGNGALPWIVFVRDKEVFKSSFPELIIKKVKLHTPFRYMVTGGLSYKSFLPVLMYPVVQVFEFMLSPFNSTIAYFQTIEIEKQ